MYFVRITFNVVDCTCQMRPAYTYNSMFVIRYFCNSKTCYLRSLFWTAICLVRLLYEVLTFIKFLRFHVYFTPFFVRPPAFYGQFSLKILVAVQSRFYCNSDGLAFSTDPCFQNHHSVQKKIYNCNNE